MHTYHDMISLLNVDLLLEKAKWLESVSIIAIVDYPRELLFIPEVTDSDLNS